MKDTQIHVDHKSNIVLIDITHGDNPNTTPIMASAEAETITAHAVGAQMQSLYPGRTFYIWDEDDYVFAYSHPSGRPPQWTDSKLIFNPPDDVDWNAARADVLPVPGCPDCNGSGKTGTLVPWGDGWTLTNLTECECVTEQLDAIEAAEAEAEAEAAAGWET